MTERIISSAIAIFSGIFSLEVVAQPHLNPQEKPKSLYIEKYLNTNPAVPGKIIKVATSELFDFYKLPLDHMICITPTKDVQLQIKVYDPTSSFGYVVDNMPNALPKGETIQ